ncbi:HyaD/HybD family hydrogenase maturation endopeptidase [Campylobacter insulaenigrae]|uniref:Hydrogenase maturation protease n=1 Tax=Campylobacter insulaenigrae TaxID=260714 RepID=A0ABY3G2G8_9BACT|nr:HyaD/HybD family hydrogenase maturation endopeptidase [Campylobacter insulaenigrae]MCR6570140.1 HyaD/HybD family hydrogenase maturation endopeptidase [Campylobacter insulaenigrae]MCR6571925.1 HyaD/HybD family hydrogenase maturation endopeptidase [Campylobacter insulaenigrae]MCR6574970.1 HyaD/HybD family hydrogenase maturation endopeptidase [Campylobacter insulaenigrae]MCR6576348.1 HyaD/HybD family hydrogenase maturation endopeptidase [Campylobacter insulaenigrae]MCR6581273.1 HyaD/HybD famil
MKILVLGIGNIMFADEGLGVHLCKLLEKNYSFHHDIDSVDFVDGGTLALQLSYIIAQYDEMVVIDCIAADDAQIGDIFFFPYEAMPKKVNWSGSAHEVEMLQTLQYMELMGDLPKTKILACVPKRIEPLSFNLSNEILPSLNKMEKILINFFIDKGFVCKKIADYKIEELALNSYKN